jgi:predicted MFS family arabinose efflux permease
MRSPVVTALVGMVALAIPMGVGRFAFTPILPMMQADAGLSITAGGWLAFANYAGTLGGALAAMTVRAPLPAAIRGGLVAIGIATVAMGLESRFAVWIALRALAGAATGWVLPLASAWALERLARQPPALRATVFAGYGVGIAVAGGACLALMQVPTRSRTAWLILGGLSLVLTAVAWRYFGDDGGPSPVERSELTAPARWDRESARLVICYGAFGFGYIVPATFLPVMARQVVSDPSVFGWAWPVFGIAAAASTFLAGTFVTALGTRRLWIAGHLVMAVGVVAPALQAGIGAIMASALLVGGTFTVITMAGFQEGRRVGGPHATRMIAAMASAFAIGQIVGPVAVSYTVGGDGGFSRPLIAAGLVLCASAWALTRRAP